MPEKHTCHGRFVATHVAILSSWEGMGAAPVIVYGGGRWEEVVGGVGIMDGGGGGEESCQQWRLCMIDNTQPP